MTTGVSSPQHNDEEERQPTFRGPLNGVTTNTTQKRRDTKERLSPTTARGIVSPAEKDVTRTLTRRAPKRRHVQKMQDNMKSPRKTKKNGSCLSKYVKKRLATLSTQPRTDTLMLPLHCLARETHHVHHTTHAHAPNVLTPTGRKHRGLCVDNLLTAKRQ